MTEPVRYPVTANHPPLRVIVNVFWRGREFQAKRVWHPRTKQPCWMYERHGETHYLPPRNDHKKPSARQWGPDPEAWWPLKPAEWRVPLPAPIVYDGRIDPAGRFVSLMRRPPQDQPLEHDGSGADNLPWWWLVDPEAPRIAYQPVGQITRDMAEGRLMRALAAAGVQATVTFRRSEDGALKRIADAAADLNGDYDKWLRDQAWNDERHPPEFWMERLNLGPQDHQDWLTAMAWFAALNPPELWHKGRKPFALNTDQKILIWRARAVGGPLSWLTIADQLGGRTRQSVKNRYVRAIERVHRVANGGRAFLHIMPRDRLAELRARNRAFARGGYL